MFDRTDMVLREQATNDNEDIMTIRKYEEAIQRQSQNIIELALKPSLDKIKDLNNQLLHEQQ